MLVLGFFVFASPALDERPVERGRVALDAAPRRVAPDLTRTLWSPGTRPSTTTALHSRAREAPAPRGNMRAAHFVASLGAPPREAPAPSALPGASSASPSDDGLPASGLRCTVEPSGALDCGECRVDGDCPPGQGCAANRSTRRHECMASECEEDAHCFPGSVCRALTRGESGVVVRRCMPAGQRAEGEACDLGYVSPEGSCQEGLVCLLGHCGKRCRRGEPDSCPTGYTCEDSLEGPACRADCQTLGCPQGERCKRLNDTDSKCLATVRGECPETPCGEGERCNLRSFRSEGVFWCAQRCQPLLGNTCPEGQVCGMGSATESTCFQTCDPRRADACAEGWECATVSEDLSQWGCIPSTNP
ncbi:hypothetical protein [Melittangium boletus]|uniref:hypothetical protein n=1 Tax=Melittangium boletus TaxID=83453 RepID=UPI003DA6C0AA